MTYNIEAIKAKINDTKDSNRIDIHITSDNGVSCTITYRIYPAYIGSAIPHFTGDINGTSGTFVITEDYSTYTAAEDRLRWAADFVANILSLTIID